MKDYHSRLMQLRGAHCRARDIMAQLDSVDPVKAPLMAGTLATRLDGELRSMRRLAQSIYSGTATGMASND